MASTYSTLKIQLMATGENNTTWGNVTNVNLGTAIEEAIVGSADVTFASATVTLALTDTNATQTARNLRLNLIGTSGGAQNLIVPAIEKVYIVNNGCADAITVKNASGTGIAVPAGKTMWVYNDATNVVNVATHLTSLTLAAALPVTSGGTGVTTSTGSGNNVLSTSPTLVTPVLGTPTSGVLSNCTGVSLTAGVSGTLPVANGGTGVTASTGSGNVVLSISPTLTTPVLGAATGTSLALSGAITAASPTFTGTTTAALIYSSAGSTGGLSLNTWVTIYTLPTDGMYMVTAQCVVGAAGYSVAAVTTKDGSSGALALGGGGAGAMEMQMSGTNVQVRQTASSSTLTATWSVLRIN